MAKEFITPTRVHQTRGYSHAVRVGDTIYISGQVGWDEQRKVSPVFEAQAAQALENLKRVLEAAGASVKDIVKITTYLKDLGDMPKYREAREKYFSPPFPASTTVQIVSLASPELLIEIEAIAVVER
ncbi:MAG: RidA family protein [Chloroflexota bacterium]|nr:RidA family protein [Chloroflexota bacterium]